MPEYKTLSRGLTERMEYEKATGTYARLAFDDEMAIRRRRTEKDSATVWRPAFIRDTDKILYCPFYNRYADKTQVFALYKNDDVTRRMLHVQLVSRIARTIGRALNLNLDLIEAISLGHDMGHPPFAHAGEKFLDELSVAHTGRHFSHNIHSVRVLDGIFPYNISLQTLIGIACHNGELVFDEYHPTRLDSFEEFDLLMEKCYQDKINITKLIPSTLEGCVVRFADIIAYLGKDRQDADRAKFLSEDVFVKDAIGSINAEIINNIIVNIIENSYGKPYIKMDKECFRALQTALRDNYRMIYGRATAEAHLDETVRPMMAELYDRLYDDLVSRRTDSPVFTHHISYVNEAHYLRATPYEDGNPHQIVIDYIASMTDDYFIELHRHFFPDSKYQVEYRGYFD